MDALTRALLAAGDVRGLLAYNQSLYGSTRCMARGYNAVGDTLQATLDGTDLNALWAEAAAAVQARNDQRQRWVDLLCYRTTRPTDNVMQFGDTSNLRMEPASEFGVPVGIRPDITFTTMAARAQWYDVGAKFTWRALADMTADQVRSVTNMALELDNRLVYELIMTQLFNPNNVTFSENNVAMTAYAFWNADGQIPPPWDGNVFPGSHNHFRISGAATITSGDLDEIIADFRSHGLSQENGSQMVVLVNSAEGAVINGFRVASGAAEDFVPAAGARFFTNDHLLGTQPVATWGGFAVKGAYGELLVIEHTRIPTGYIVGLTSGGTNNPTNAIMLREHPVKTGLQIIPGANNSYPLIDSYYTHFAGTGVRQRGAGLIMQIKASGSYVAPPSLVI